MQAVVVTITEQGIINCLELLEGVQSFGVLSSSSKAKSEETKRKSAFATPAHMHFDHFLFARTKHFHCELALKKGFEHLKDARPCVF